MRKTIDRVIYLLIGLLLVGLNSGSVFAAENIDPDNDGSQYGWGENIGWANAEPGGDGGPGVFVEDDGLSSYIWGENVGWISLSCLNTSSCGTVDYGVTNDGGGTLDGFGWGENIGWVNFAPATGGGVTIDPGTGEFHGDAWGENVGWIRVRGTGAVAYGITTGWPGGGGPMCTPAPDPDLNDDGIVNILDISTVGSCFGQDPNAIARCQVADTNCDDVIDMTDVQFVSGSFGQTVP